MKTIALYSASAAFFLAASCGRKTQPSGHLAASSDSQKECEETVPLTVVKGSEFPAGKPIRVRVASMTAKAKCFQGGFGWRVSSWDLIGELEVANLDYDKRFFITIPNGPRGVSQTLALDAKYVGKTRDTFDRFTFSYNLGSLNSIQLSVIMPAQFNATPNIGNPIAGWYGPTYGLSVTR